MLRRMERSAVHLLRKRGKSLRAIAAELGHSKTTIARALSEPVDQLPPRRRRVSRVDPWRSQIAEWLRQGLSGVRMVASDAVVAGQASASRSSGKRPRIVSVGRSPRIGRWCSEHRHAPARERLPTRGQSGAGYWLNRRSDRGRWTWDRFARYMRAHPLPPPIAVHSVLRHAAKP